MCRLGLSSRVRALLAMAGVLLVAAWLYAPALGFGFMWDDPTWYGRVVGKSFAELVRPMPDYQFYRPGVALYNRLFMGRDQTFSAPIMHAVQIGWHLLDVALVYALCRRLRAGKGVAIAAAGLVACYPLSQQAVAWVAPQQAMVAALQNGAWLAYLAARHRGKVRWPAALLSLVLFVVGLAVQEITAALALVPLLMELVLHRTPPLSVRAIVPRLNRSMQNGADVPLQRGIPAEAGPPEVSVPLWRGSPAKAGPPEASGGIGLLLALIYPIIAAGFVLAWRTLPRPPGYPDWGLRPEVILYFLQGLVYPVLGRVGGYAPGQTISAAWIAVLSGAILCGLLLAAWRAGRLRLALFGLALVVLGSGPPAAGLRYEYVCASPRLLYYSAPGIALLWAGALLPPPAGGWVRRLWRTGGAALLGLIALQSVLLVSGFQRMYAAGAAHMAEFIRVVRTGERLLFVNFPDQFALKRPPYPMGYWGMLLAPGSVDLSEFSALVTGERPVTFSRRMPWVDGEMRDAGPYRVDMRGEQVPADQLYQLAHQVDRIYLSRYNTDGTFVLQWAGTVVSPTLPAVGCRLAVFDETLCLQDAQVEAQADRLSVILTWSSLTGAQPNDTIFTHLGQAGQPPLAQADGDPWLGILPLTLLQPGDVILDHRVVPLPEALPSGRYEIRVGLYNRVTGERMPAMTPGGTPLLDNAITVGYFP